MWPVWKRFGAVDNLGAYSIPPEAGLLPSDYRGNPWTGVVGDVECGCEICSGYGFAECDWMFAWKIMAAVWGRIDGGMAHGS